MADTLDLISLAEGKSAVNIASADTSQDTELAAYITGVSRRIDTLCGAVVNRTITSETHWQGGGAFIDLKYRPAYSVTTVTEYDTSGTSTTLTAESVSSKPANGYLLDTTPLVPYRIYRRESGGPSLFPAGGAVVVTYVAGRYATTAAVDEVFKRAAAIMLAQLWRREQGIGSETFGAVTDFPGQIIPTFAVPRAVLELLAEHLRPTGVA